MPGLSAVEAIFLGTVLEGFLYGVYAVVFALYLRVQLRRKAAGYNLLIYPLSVCFGLCTVFFVLDFTQQFITIFRGGELLSAPWNINLTTSTIYSFVDVISQGILIYRCWVMWGKRFVFVVLPVMLAGASFATSITLVGELAKSKIGSQKLPVWFFQMGVASFSLSLSVNTIVTSLLIFRLHRVHRELVQTQDPNEKPTGTDLKPLISFFIESGMLTFIGQLIWVVLFRLQNNGFNAVGSPITMIYGITPTVVVVRISMGTSYENTVHPKSIVRFNNVHDDRATSITVSSSAGGQKSLNSLQNNNNDSEYVEKSAV